MIKELSKLVSQLNDPLIRRTSVLLWGSPILSFGSIEKSRVATLGLNPSNREFVDVKGDELNGALRRFHSLSSLKIRNWEDANAKHIKSILELSENYFIRNPYDNWFKKLDYLITGTNASYYFPTLGACHLDLIPYATSKKWSDISAGERNLLLKLSKHSLGCLLKDSNIDLLVLNGQAVVENFERINAIKLEKQKMPSWRLPRKSGSVDGYSFVGEASSISGEKLRQPVLVLGYNHNVQSSFGVTSKVLKAMRDWITETYRKQNKL